MDVFWKPTVVDGVRDAFKAGGSEGNAGGSYHAEPDGADTGRSRRLEILGRLAYLTCVSIGLDG